MLYSVRCPARRRKERLPLSATSPSSQPTTHLPPAPPFSVSGVCHACPERLGDLVGALDPIFLSPVRPPHFPPKPFRMRRSKKRWGGGVYGSTGRPASTPRPNDIAGKDLMLRDRGCNSLAFGFEHGAVFDALHELHFDFRLLVGHAFGGFRRDDQRLWAIGQIKRALELQRLDAALLAGILLQ